MDGDAVCGRRRAVRAHRATFIADKLRRSDMITRIVNGGVNMPAHGANLRPGEIECLVTFLESRTKH
jgi:hypothetical protein